MEFYGLSIEDVFVFSARDATVLVATVINVPYQ
jgi:hypothetical protein